MDVNIYRIIIIKPSVWDQYVVVCCFVSVEFSANPSDCSRYAVICFVSIEFSINPAGVHRYSAGIFWVIGLFLQNRQSEVCMLLSAVLSAGIDRYLWVAAGSPFSVGVDLQVPVNTCG